MILIGVGHRAKQGKSLFCSTIAEICSRQGIECIEYSFSDEIIARCIDEGILPPGTMRADCDPSFLVRVVTEWRVKSPGVLVERVRPRIEEERPAVALIPNVKLYCEHEMVRELGGFNVRVTRLNANGTRFISPDRDPNDTTETELEHAQWDFEIRNMHGKPWWLRRQAAALFDYLKDGAE